MTQTCGCFGPFAAPPASRAETNATRRPSGDHDGSVSLSSLNVNCRAPVPSALTIQRWVRAAIFGSALRSSCPVAAGASTVRPRHFGPFPDRVQHGMAVRGDRRHPAEAPHPHDVVERDGMEGLPGRLGHSWRRHNGQHEHRGSNEQASHEFPLRLMTVREAAGFHSGGPLAFQRMSAAGLAKSKVLAASRIILGNPELDRDQTSLRPRASRVCAAGPVREQPTGARASNHDHGRRPSAPAGARSRPPARGERRYSRRRASGQAVPIARRLGAGPRHGGSACGHASPRPCEAEGEHQREHGVGVGPRANSRLRPCEPEAM